MINDAIVPSILNTSATIAIIQDAPILNDILRLFVCKTRLIPNAKPIIPAIRLPIEKTMVNKAAILFESALTNKINTTDKIENDEKIQAIVTNTPDPNILA
jgi:hypothetical protein